MESRRSSNKTVGKIVKIAIIVIIIGLLIIGALAFFFFRSGLSPVAEESSDQVAVEIPQGANRNQIADILEENNLIDSSLVFNMYTRVNNEGDFQAGIHQLSPSMSVPELVDNLQESGASTDVQPITTVTIREGITLQEMSNAIEAETEFSGEAFMNLMEDQDFLSQKVEEFPQLLSDVAQEEQVRYLLEGYLYPATYDVYEDSTLESLTTQMIDQLDQVMQAYYDDIESSDFDVNQTLTLASMIEGEAPNDADRRLVSGVFHNRLELGMPLQTDVSVIYAVGEHLERVLYEHLEVDSPYNLYQNTGLSPGPVVNPSESSIDAAIHPEDTDYLYFLSDLGTGEFYYSEDYDTHLEYQNEILRENYFGD